MKMSSATVLACNKKIQNCLYTNIFKALLHCCTTSIKAVQFEARMFSITFYFSVLIIWIWE